MVRSLVISIKNGKFQIYLAIYERIHLKITIELYQVYRSNAHV